MQQLLTRCRRGAASWRRTRYAVGCVLSGLVLVFFAACATPPPPVAPPSSTLQQAIKIAAGWSHTCALTADGRVRCWGNNQDGQLGDGTRRSSSTPEAVVGLLGTTKELALGERHTCVLTTAGAAKCWGSNHDAQLGDGTRADRVSPVEVAALPDGLRAISAGEHHSCVLTAIGGVRCWGRNKDGQLGDGSTEDRLTPVPVIGLDRGVVSIAAGWRHTCAALSTGGVKCWGSNKDGQLGDGTALNRLVPVDVKGVPDGATLIVAGGRHTCAGVKGAVKCWGHNERGQLGDGTTVDKTTAVDAVGLTQAVGLTAGWQHTCAVTTSGAVSCWGNNEKGQVGKGGPFVRLVPTPIVEKLAPTAASASTPTNVPAAAATVAQAMGVAAGGQHTCLLTTDNAVRCWGENEYGQLGEAPTR